MAVLAIAVIQTVHNDDDQIHLRAEIYGTIMGRSDFQCVVNGIDTAGSLGTIRTNVEDGIKSYLINERGIVFQAQDTVKCL